MRLTPRQQAIAASWLNRALAGSGWRLQEVKHEDVDSDSVGRALDWHQRLWTGIVGLMLWLLPYRYRLLFELAQRWHRSPSRQTPVSRARLRWLRQRLAR